MKIIAEVSRDYEGKWICELSGHEIAKLLGKHYTEVTVRVGQVLNIADAWAKLRSINDHAEDLPRIANKLRALADLLEPITVEIPGNEGDA